MIPCRSSSSSRRFLCFLVLIIVVFIAASASICVDAQNATTISTTVTAPAPTPPPAPTTSSAAATTTGGGGNASTAAPVATTAAIATGPIGSRIDLIFSFFAEDRDNVNSYAVTIAQMLNVPPRRIDFYNKRPGDTIPEDQLRPSNTPFGDKTMVRITCQPPAAVDPANAPSARQLRDNLLKAVKDGNPALKAIFIDDANPIDIPDSDVFQYSVKTVFDVMYTFIIGTMGLAYLVFVSYVVVKLVEAHQYSKIERINRQKEKEMRKIKAKAQAHGGGQDAGAEDEDDENEVVDASRWDDVGDDNGDDHGDELVRDEDGMAVRTLANDVANMLRADQEGVSIFGNSGRIGGTESIWAKKAFNAKLKRLELPPETRVGADEIDPDEL